MEGKRTKSGPFNLGLLNVHNASVINAAILNGKEEIFASEATIRVYKEKTFDFKQHALTPVKGAKFAHLLL